MQSPYKLQLSSDLHLGHENMITGLSYRPADYEDQILENHLRMEEGDTWVCLGDLFNTARGKSLTEFLVKELKQKGVPSICVMGNHDPQTIGPLLKLGFAMAMDRIQLRFHGRHLVLTHEPLDHLGNMLNVHGHLHSIEGHRGGLKKDGKHILLSAELMKYRPIELGTLMKLNCTPKFEGGRFVKAL